jgi:hypothetical protein
MWGRVQTLVPAKRKVKKKRERETWQLHYILLLHKKGEISGRGTTGWDIRRVMGESIYKDMGRIKEKSWKISLKGLREKGWRNQSPNKVKSWKAGHPSEDVEVKQASNRERRNCNRTDSLCCHGTLLSAFHAKLLLTSAQCHPLQL